VERLARWAFVGGSPLEGESVDSFGKALLKVGAGLRTREPENVVNGDLKVYESAGYKFGIAQVEVTDLVEMDEELGVLEEALGELRDQRGLDFTMLMVTDIVGGSSRILLKDPPPALSELPYKRLPDGSLEARGVVSRKKQLLPTVLALLEG
jgi:manganese-dependent inorganic pyrophosphatase